jgi:hypothetical protein
MPCRWFLVFGDTMAAAAGLLGAWGRDDHNQRESRQARHLQGPSARPICKAKAGLAIAGVGTILPVILSFNDPLSFPDS